MSKINNQAQGAVEAAENAVTVKPSTVEMTAEDFQKWERNVQLGVTDELPDGRKLADVQKDYAEQQLAQEEERRAAALPKEMKLGDDATIVPQEIKPDMVMEVTVHANGAVSATPKVEAATVVAATQNGDSDDEKEPDNDLPVNYPGRKALLAAGHVSLEKVATFSLEDLIGIKGIKTATAEAMLDYGKAA